MPSEIIKRVALFAHYDAGDVIDEYVLYTLAGLCEVATDVLFVSDSNLPDQEIAKLNGLAKLVYTGKHSEYDFGSWKRGWNHLGNTLHSYDEVILINDSCYGPIFPFAETFDAMAGSKCDFWGQTASGGKADSRYPLHIDSYFIVLRKSVVSGGVLDEFFANVRSLPSKKSVVEQLEIGLSETLMKAGYKLGSLVEPSVEYQAESTGFIENTQISMRCPCVKVKIFRDNRRSIPRVYQFAERLSGFYPMNLVVNHCKRIRGNKSFYRWFLTYPTLRRDLLSSWFVKARARYVANSHFWVFYVTLLKIPVFLFVWPTFVHSRLNIYARQAWPY